MNFTLRTSLSLALCCFVWLATAQVTVSVTVNSGSSTTTCNDFFSAPDPLWRVNVANAGWVAYPAAGACFQSFPFAQYTRTYACGEPLPTTIQVCFEALENDDTLFELGIGCGIAGSCTESICQDFVIPLPGASAMQTMALAPGLSSGGEVSFTLSTVLVAPAANDLPCGAIDLGTLDYGATLGDASQGLYSNSCATNLNEPQPTGFFTNDAGVWFRFTTGPAPSGLLLIDILSDPQAVGDAIDIQAILFASSNNNCDGAFSIFPEAVSSVVGLDAPIRVLCPSPNTTYYVLVDGDLSAPGLQRGVFGIQVRDIGQIEGGDLRCEFDDLGTVPVNGMVSTNGLRSNFCATPAQDPFTPAFVSQHSVWFRFVAPPSGHVIIEAISDTLIPLDIQIAIYRSFNNQCNGFFSHVQSQYDGATPDETMEMTCLFGGTPYWILIDGGGSAFKGLFSIAVRDAGDITPVLMQDTVLCAGGSLQVGPNLYTSTGLYFDTLQVFAGCDSIVVSNITVLDPVMASVTQTQPAIGLTATGIATVAASGGSGTYTYLWCNGGTEATNALLLGGENCCVTVTDDIGCAGVVCFDVDFVTGIIPVFSNDTLLCHGDNNGVVTFTALNGLPPYNYTWQNATGTLSGSGMIVQQGDAVSVPELPAGAYNFTLADANFDTSFTALIVEPLPLNVEVVSITDASCFAECDGQVEIAVTGGTGAYTFAWSGSLPSTPSATGLCAGAYSMTVTDANGCMVNIAVNVDQPLPFIAQGQLLQAVTCFGGSDGSATVSVQNGSAAQYRWDVAGSILNSAVINGLPTGSYPVTVTNVNGCEASTTVQVPQPALPLSVQIEQAQAVSCSGSTDGALRALPAGPFSVLTYAWSNGQSTPIATALSAGDYQLTITNEVGCRAETGFVLGEPDAIFAVVSAENITCLDPENGGQIWVDEVGGGVGNFVFSVDGQSFTSNPSLIGLTAGAYEVTVRDAAGCTLVLPAVVQGPPTLLVDLGPELLIRLGETAVLTALVNSDDAQFTWGHTDTLSAAKIPVSPIQSTIYTVTAFDSLTFCTATATVSVVVDRTRRVFIPNAFSPNGDGINDMLTIYGDGSIMRINTLRIFSRTGNLVYEATDFEPNQSAIGWNGIFEGRPAPAGVYVYMAEITFKDGAKELFKGDAVLVR